MHMMHGYGSVWSMIVMVVFWVGLLTLGIYLLVSFVNGGSRKTALQTLKERLASGEIDETEYERLKSIIKHDGKK